MTRNDLILIGVILLAALLATTYLRGQTGEELVASVEIAGEMVLSFPVSVADLEHHQISFARGEATIEAAEGRVRILPMPSQVCPLNICSATGWIGRPGQTIVCLPNRIVITLRAQDQDLDGVTR